MNAKTLTALLAVVCVSLLAGCNTAPKTEEGRANLHDDVQAALNRFNRQDPDLQHFLDNAAGYAMFPSISKAAFIGGGAYGKGEAFSNGQMIGWADIRQGSVGLQAGVEEYAELVVFGTREALQKFEDEKLSFGADASAVILKAGASRGASFRDGVAVFTDVKGGAMLGVSLNGQKLTFHATNEDNNGRTETTETHTETHTESNTNTNNNP